MKVLVKFQAQGRRASKRSEARSLVGFFIAQKAGAWRIGLGETAILLRSNSEVFMPILEEVAGVGDSRRFEIVLADMISTFVRVTGDKVDDEIDRWLERIGLVLGIDRATVAEHDPRDGSVPMTHCWVREGIRALPKGADALKCVPWLARKFMAGEIVSFSSPEELPPEALADVQFVSPMGAKSNLTIPMKVGGKIIGAVAFGSISRERIWSSSTVRRLELVAEIFGSALERKREMASVRRLEKQLYRVSSVAMLGELTASLVHELNQPMTAILSNAQAARRMVAADSLDVEELKATLDDIARDDERAVEIIRWVRGLFSGGQSEKSPVRPEDVLIDVERILKHDALARGVAFRRQVKPPLPAVFANRAQLTQALINLIMNAFDAVAENDHSRREVVVSAAMAENDQLSLTVCDSGKGIDSRLLPKLFDAFFTTRSNGMGMGLAIARTIVENHGGKLRAFANRDCGSTFEIALPTAETAPPNP